MKLPESISFLSHLHTGTSSEGGGGGGRIAVYYDSVEFTGQYQAYGGQSAAAVGGPGTVYVDHRGQAKKLFVTNIRGAPRTVSSVCVCSCVCVGREGGRCRRGEGQARWMWTTAVRPRNFLSPTAGWLPEL